MGIRVQGVNLERRDLGRSVVYVCNHQHALDMPMMGLVCPSRLVIIGKKELRWYPFFGQIFAAGGNLFIDRQNKSKAYQGLTQVLEIVKGMKASVFLFPEGTRNRSKDPMLPFKKGAFYMAIQARIPVVPIVISPMEQNRRTGKATVEYLEPIETDGFKPGQEQELSDLVRSRMLTKFGDLMLKPEGSQTAVIA